MDISNITPVRIGNKYIARVNKFPRNVYLTLDSKNRVHTASILLAKEMDSLQEIIDLANAYLLNTVYDN